MEERMQQREQQLTAMYERRLSEQQAQLERTQQEISSLRILSQVLPSSCSDYDLENVSVAQDQQEVVQKPSGSNINVQSLVQQVSEVTVGMVGV